MLASAYAGGSTTGSYSGGKHLIATCDIDHGRLKRAAGDALCKPAAKFWGLEPEPGRSLSETTCGRCRRVADQLGCVWLKHSPPVTAVLHDAAALVEARLGAKAKEYVERVIGELKNARGGLRCLLIKAVCLQLTIARHACRGPHLEVDATIRKLERLAVDEFRGAVSGSAMARK